jgi:DNA primase catalytic core
MKVHNLDNLIERIKAHFREYLEMHETEFTTSHFTCPNRFEHKNDDGKPSAAFFPNQDHFKCFSCESSGDIFTAANYIEGKPLQGKEFITDNVLYLADLFGEEYDVEEMTEDEIKREALYKALEDTCLLSSKVLQQDSPKLKEVKDYIASRGWEDLVEEFDFGYCSYDKLIEALKKRGHTEDTLREVGLIPSKDAKGVYERYLLEDRLIFPIRNEYGKIVAFGSRLIREPKNDKEQKYLQSRNTGLYNKTNTLFNLDKARCSDKVYIVEGYADVFTLSKYGIDNCVALCGLSFPEIRYKALAKNAVSNIVFCLDNDTAGKNALERIIDKELKNLKGINVTIKTFPEDCEHKDVDEYILAEGVDAFNSLPELTIFQFKIEKLINDPDDIIVKNDLIQLIVQEEDFTKKESMCNVLSEIIGITSEAILKEVNRNARLGKGNELTTTEDMLEEMNCFERVLNDWDRKVWSRTSGLLGLNAKNFPLFTKYMDGVQNMFYLVAGDTNIGKSAFMLNMAMDLINSNDDVFVLFFSVDDSISQLLPRMIALDTELEINTISNPKYKIQHNEDLPEKTRDQMILDRNEGIEKLRKLSDRFAIKEESQAKFIEDIEKYIKIYKKIAGARQLVIFVDNLHRICSKEKMETRQLFTHISNRLKLWKTEYDVPVIATAEIRKTENNKRPKGTDIKETKSLEFDADAVMMLYSDFHTNPNTKLKTPNDKIEDLDEDDDNFNKPIIEMNVVKNKTSAFKKKLYYKFYPEYSLYLECSYDEIGDLRRTFNEV